MNQPRELKVVSLVAGAGGMYCGSCLRDNRLAASLMAAGRDVTLLPLYTPIRTDEPNVAAPRVFYGGVNAFLQQWSALFRRRLPLLDTLLDHPVLLRAAGKLASATRAEDLGGMTVSVLLGRDGHQRKELDKLIVALRALEPSVVHLPNLMFVGTARSLSEALGAKIVCSLSGEDIFLDQLTEMHRGRAFDLIRQFGDDVDAFVSPTLYYAEHAVEHFALPRDRIHHVPMGVDTSSLRDDRHNVDRPADFTIGFFARQCAEKGLDRICDAFVLLHSTGRTCRLKIGGYLSKSDRTFVESLKRRVADAGLSDRCEFMTETDAAGKARFLRSIDVLSVPTTYVESKGLYVLESFAAGVPVVLPKHGSFVEFVEQSDAGVLFEPNTPESLAKALAGLMDDDNLRRSMADRAVAAARSHYTHELMADRTWSLYEEIVRP
jgi:glycosyltransferase involved in cell wall biosynthesis